MEQMYIDVLQVDIDLCILSRHTVIFKHKEDVYWLYHVTCNQIKRNIIMYLNFDDLNLAVAFVANHLRIDIVKFFH